MTASRDAKARGGVGRVSLRLYVAGQSPNSLLALSRVRALSAGVEPGCDVEVVDLLTQPERAILDGVVVTPLLVRLVPLPEIRIAGNLDDIDAVRQMLALRGVV